MRRRSCPSPSVSELRSRPRNRHASDYPCAISRKRTARPLVTIHSDLRTNNFSELLRYLRADNRSSFAGSSRLLLVTLDVLEITLLLLSGVPRFERADLLEKFGRESRSRLRASACSRLRPPRNNAHAPDRRTVPLALS